MGENGCLKPHAAVTKFLRRVRMSLDPYMVRGPSFVSRGCLTSAASITVSQLQSYQQPNTFGIIFVLPLIIQVLTSTYLRPQPSASPKPHFLPSIRKPNE